MRGLVDSWTRGQETYFARSKRRTFSSLNAQRSSYKSPSHSFDKLRTRRGGFRRGSSFIVNPPPVHKTVHIVESLASAINTAEVRGLSTFHDFLHYKCTIK